ncbi:RES domain-containing protein [Arthrobacter sp. FW305-BF8]|uniref:RES domain-containing protein n=1 Tax=Arthrobacter sp. FW305-BF8 TaxID=2879617 RepID=UPI001F1BBC37|nr:RES domain-containing protein [Arthrobacter sp. FW305-BF8]UKA55168.1 RES domain-containing protein [Arthrobacter sp. FW305-BF8]
MSGASESWLADTERGYATLDGAVCRAHITDNHLKEKLSAAVEDDGAALCVLCSAGLAIVDLVPLTELQRHVMAVFTSVYEPAEKAGVPWDDGWQGAGISDPAEILYEVCEKAIDDQVFDSFVGVLEEAVLEQDWTENRHPSSLDAAYWGWDQFEEDVRTRSRFIFPSSDVSSEFAAPGQRSESFLQGLLPYVEKEELGLVSIVPAGTLFYRGRLVSDDRSTLVSAADLGPAPAKLAAVNRMSPEGIPMFYGSATPETAIEEIATHGTRNYARIGAFKSQKDLRVLDLTRDLNMPSLFAPDALDQFGVLQFFRKFAANVTAPMGPDDNPNLTYVPTQVITEFFRWVPKTPIDGIKLRSAQNGEDTFVLFLDAESVEDAPDARGTASASPGPNTLGWFGIDPIPPVLTLDPKDVKTYKLNRKVTATLVEPSSDSKRSHSTLTTP